MNNILSTSLLSLFVAVHGVQAQVVTTCNNFGHFDLYIDVEPPASDGGSLIIDSTEQFSVEASTGRAIVLANFGDFPGGPHKTDDPGWVVSAGDLLGGEFLWFRALGSLRFWDKDQQRWLDNPPNEARVRYFGAIPPEVVINGTDEENAFYAQGTIWSADGVEGPIEAPIEQAADIETGDAIHAHLDFCVEDSAGDCTIPQVGFTGSPAIGAYLIEIQLFSNAVSANGQQKYFDSPPIKVLLNNGLVAEECTSAIGALVVPDTVVDDSEALPAAGVLIMSGP